LKFFVIGDDDTVLGFRLAGVEGAAVHDAASARKSLAQAIGDKGIGVIVMPERVAGWIRPEVDGHLFKAEFPLIIEVPDIQGPVEGRKSVKDMIRAAVGVQL
jgi:V/A-type H+/Na+-transporting ATPase subunit F